MDKEHRMLNAKQLQAQGLKQWQIAHELEVTERTVRNYLKNDLSSRLRRQRESKLNAFKPFIEAVLDENPYLNVVVLQKRLEKQGYSGKISILRDLVADLRRKIITQAVIRFETEPGFQAQVDWKEFGKQFVDGREQKLYAFVMLLGFSRRMFVCFTTSMKQSVFLACHILAFLHFGGVPQEILYDNMKTAFVRNSEGRFEPNKKLLTFAAHYHFVPRRCRIRRPETKGKVERSIGYLGNNFWQSIEGEPLSLAFLNEAVKTWLEEADAKPIGGLGESRALRFLRETPHLLPLPATDFDTREEIPVMVNRESMVCFETNSYSVHPDHIGKMLVLRVDRLKNEAQINDTGVLIKTISLFASGARMRLMEPADREAILKRWEIDRARREKHFRQRKRHPQRERGVDPEVVVRSPADYDRLLEMIIREAV